MRAMQIERAWSDPGAVPASRSTTTSLTDATEPRWTGIVELAPNETYRLEAHWRHDLYVLRGSADADGHTLVVDDFLVRCDHTLVRAGEAGTRLLLYREASDGECHALLRRAAARTWRRGVNPRMQVATLAGGAQQVSLVAWQPDARTLAHGHARGEELFVLSGELRDGDQRHPAGTWLRFHPGAVHAPFAEVPTTILLRHGHLSGDAGA